MAISAVAVEILIEKARFEPQVALGVAEAIEATIMHAQLVTVAVFEARIQELRTEIRISQMAIESKLAEMEVRIQKFKSELEVKIEAVKADVVRWVFLTMIGNVALSAGVAAILKHLG